MTQVDLIRLSKLGTHVLLSALSACLNWIKALILIALVLAPIVIAFAIGVLFAIGVRMVYAAREGFKDGQRLING